MLLSRHLNETGTHQNSLPYEVTYIGVPLMIKVPTLISMNDYDLLYLKQNPALLLVGFRSVMLAVGN